MKRQDYLVFFLLVALLFAWPGIYRKFFAEPTPPPAVPEQIATDADTVPGDTDHDAGASIEAPTQPVVPAEAVAAATTDDEEEGEAQVVRLANEQVELALSTRGAAVVGATLLGYREALAADSAFVAFDFSGRPSMAYQGLPGFSANNLFGLVGEPESARAVMERSLADGLSLRREVTLGDNYLVTVTDTFSNGGENPVELKRHQVLMGLIPEEKAHRDLVGMVNMGVDSLPPAGTVQNWGKDLPKQFKNVREDLGLASLPETIDWKPANNPVDWVAAKNKYFVQILKPDGDGADWFDIHARREISADELAGRRAKNAIIDGVAASLGFDGQVLAAGETYTRTYEYYVGPKNFAILSGLSHGRDAAMGFEENAYMDFIVVPAAKILLRLLNMLHDHVFANYGVAIILLTLIVKIVFWPITHKGTESMRRMAAIQPLMAEIREKYKDNPQKMQQAMMGLYKEHKINPIGGCLPMLVQIPVFFALFVVLRIAIELRFAGFLWIHDLSAPERLVEFGFAIPLLGWDALNLLPLLMTATMIIQQKMTPTAGDPQQQKIMMVMMPLMMLFFLYNFASGLALYWTTQNALMILQQVLYKQRRKRQEAAAAAA